MMRNWLDLSFSVTPGEAFYVPCPADQEQTKRILTHFRANLFQNDNKIWIGQNIKYDLLVLKWYDISLAGKLFDTMLAHYVFEPDGKRGMDLLSSKYLGYEPVHIEELIGKKVRQTAKNKSTGESQGTMRDVELEKIKEYAAEDADITLQLKNVFTPLLKEKDVEKVFNEVEVAIVESIDRYGI